MNIEIIVGSMLGATEYVADEVQAVLSAKGIDSRIHLTPDLTELNRDNTWFICTSTHGAGDLPDNIQAFATALQGQQLPNVNYLIIGVGDSNYDTFCQAAYTIDDLMKQSESTSLSPVYTVDVDEHMEPELVVADWLTANIDNLLQ